MTGPLYDRIERTYAEFEQKKAAIGDIDRQVSETQTTVTAKNRALTVVVDGRGDVTEVKFLTNAHRTMAPAELGNLLVETIKEARTEARRKAATLFESVLSPGLPLAGLLSGGKRADQMFDEAMRSLRETFGEAKPTAGEDPEASRG
ncbi:YbaB/EbfC family nucleoid-associated protein [Micromonospora krabiensis]|uniref:YbaB/EbfC DNA-binding family protein n=1 Tax=Micromonospora krabiensis TaxID=307121 RepID=A0A1C3MXM4_9ACTN|nr:YbaB/EbfC family nucleoid-associated protein [Micromonospora krabiensis]SBV25061.1 YbaB/EbfC DNA-binding family protein [Micromonospora krabiensis]